MFDTIDKLRELGTPRYHGNGFTQLYLSKDVRLHVWTPDLKPLRDHNAMIHNHRYDVSSTIYAGTLTHTTYDLDEEAPKDTHDVRVIQLDGASDAHKSPEIETGRTAKLMVRHKYQFAAGSKYTFRNPWFHTSEITGNQPVVTIFERYNKSSEWAQVLCGIDDKVATHAFAPETQPPEERLWWAISEGVTRANEAFHQRIHDIYFEGAS